MESLDSTLETKRPAAALSLLSQQKKQQQVVASPDGKKSTCISFLWEESNYTCKRFWKYKNLIVTFSFLKRARQTFKVSRRLISFNLQRGGVIFVSGALRRTFVNGIHRASLLCLHFLCVFSHRGGSKPGGKSTFNVKNRN